MSSEKKSQLVLIFFSVFIFCLSIPIVIYFFSLYHVESLSSLIKSFERELSILWLVYPLAIATLLTLLSIKLLEPKASRIIKLKAFIISYPIFIISLIITNLVFNKLLESLKVYPYINECISRDIGIKEVCNASSIYNMKFVLLVGIFGAMGGLIYKFIVNKLPAGKEGDLRLPKKEDFTDYYRSIAITLKKVVKENSLSVSIISLLVVMTFFFLYELARTETAAFKYTNYRVSSHASFSTEFSFHDREALLDLLENSINIGEGDKSDSAKDEDEAEGEKEVAKDENFYLNRDGFLGEYLYFSSIFEPGLEWKSEYVDETTSITLILYKGEELLRFYFPESSETRAISESRWLSGTNVEDLISVSWRPDVTSEERVFYVDQYSASCVSGGPGGYEPCTSNLTIKHSDKEFSIEYKGDEKKLKLADRFITNLKIHGFGDERGALVNEVNVDIGRLLFVYPNSIDNGKVNMEVEVTEPTTIRYYYNGEYTRAILSSDDNELLEFSYSGSPSEDSYYPFDKKQPDVGGQRNYIPIEGSELVGLYRATVYGGMWIQIWYTNILNENSNCITDERTFEPPCAYKLIDNRKDGDKNEIIKASFIGDDKDIAEADKIMRTFRFVSEE